MVDLLKTGSDFLEARRKAYMTQTVTYQRGVDTVSVSATIGRTVFEVDREAGIHEEVEARDYLIQTADLALNSVAVLPVAGDRILETAGGTTYTYEVMSPPGNEPPYRYSDAYRTTLRVHTKLVTTS